MTLAGWAMPASLTFQMISVHTIQTEKGDENRKRE